MSLNSLPIDTAQCDYYDGISNITSTSRMNNVSSMRVQFRMDTHKNATIRNANFVTSSVSQQNIANNAPSPYNENIPFTRNYQAPSPHQPGNHHQRMQFTETNIHEKTISYDTYTEAIPINIGTAPAPSTKTFQLTEDLKSNIKLDITLGPSMSIRDNRVDHSRSNSIRSGQAHDLNMACVGVEPHPDLYARQRQAYIQNEMGRASRGHRDMSSRYYQTMPDTHSSLIRLTFSGRSGSNKKILINSFGTEPTVLVNNYGQGCAVPVPGATGSRMSSPFTYIETSSRRKLSMSPSGDEMHKARTCFVLAIYQI